MNTNQSVVIDFKDFIFVILKRIVIILLVGVLFCGFSFCYKYISNTFENRRIEENNSSKVLDVSVRLQEESEVQYNERILDVNHVNDLINGIDVLNKQIENQRKYVSNSIFMKIDSENEAVTTSSLIMTVDGSQNNKVDSALFSTYKQYILSGEYLINVSEELDVNQGYISELISVNYEYPTIVLDNSNQSVNSGVITIKVIGPTTEFTEKIMNVIIENVEIKYNEYKKDIMPHTITFADIQSSYKVDNGTRDQQVNATYRFEALQQQINSYEKQINEIASRLGVEKEDIYTYIRYDSEFSGQTSLSAFRSTKKYAALGFMFGVLIVVIIITCSYFFGNKFSTQSKFFCRFYWVYKIGVVKPNIKRSRLIAFFDNLSGDDNKLTKENYNKLLAANIHNLTSEMNNILITGTAEKKRIDALINDLGIKADVKSSFFDDPDYLNNLSFYDGIILVEQRNYSNMKYVKEELELISNAQIKLIGAIII